MDTPGTDCTIEVMSVIPRSWRSWPVSAVMLMGVVCTVDSRFCAVTTISWIWSDLLSSCAKATFAPATLRTYADTNPSILADIFRFIAFPRYQPRQEEWPAVDIMLHEHARGRDCSRGDIDEGSRPGSAPPASGGVTGVMSRLDHRTPECRPISAAAERDSPERIVCVRAIRRAVLRASRAFSGLRRISRSAPAAR